MIFSHFPRIKPEERQALMDLEAKLDTAIQKMGAAFIRLDSRSPKVSNLFTKYSPFPGCRSQFTSNQGSVETSHYISPIC
jgi:hypothetical protein